MDGQALAGNIPTGFGVYAQLVADALALLKGQRRLDYRILYPEPRDKPLASVWQRVAWEQFTLRSHLKEPRPSLLHSPCLGAPLWPPVPLVCTVHDLILLDEDLPGSFARFYFKTLIPVGWRQAKLVLTDTRFVRQQVIQRLRLPAERVVALPLCSRFESAAPRSDPPTGQPTFLLVGSVEPRKGFATAIEALALLPTTLRQDVRVLITGHHTHHAAELTSLAQRLEVASQVEFAPYRAEIEPFYRGATALIFPSLAEGFGLPPLEAMSLGTPVLLSNIEVLRETYGETGGKPNPGMFAANDAEALAALMRRVLEDRAFSEGLTAFGLEIAAGLTRERFAAGLLAAYERALGRT
jgi:glycosyltransferase involved in cell wall biosynthesis